MTVSTVFDKKSYPCNGVTVDFSWPYRTISASDIKVYKVEIATEIETLLSLSTDYNLSTVPSDSVTVTTTTAYSSDFKIVIDMTPSFLQEIDFTTFGKFPADTVENGFDILTLQNQYNRSIASNAITINPTLADFSGTGIITAGIETRKSKVIGFSDDGDSVELYEFDAASAAAAAASATSAANSATAAAASAESVEDRHLGSKTSDPTTKNDGDPLTGGEQYWNSALGVQKIYNNISSSWETYTPSVAAPTGSLVAFAGSSAPTGYLLCYGQAVSRTTYAALYAVIADTYGAGDGSTTFNLPDLRGRGVVGVDDMGGTNANNLTANNALGDTGGEESVSLVAANNGPHDHLTIKSGSVGSGAGYPTNTTYLAAQGVFGYDESYAVRKATTAPDIALTSEQGSGTAHENMHPYICINYIIKT